ncbi:MAG: hypothetical protein WCS83_00370 [Endomicrobiia bacterium]|jgi:hypothetical protein|nr:hypothetical protein [Endomicrobiaceae bacterium]MDD3053150.1 hypothetical protein [Endomicrobiaceae bacterium]MDD3922078.1 hypothetical protein [Endomicrobiaceae bacterium]MDD5101825.1 hypothetical protein [Endomicrobiaceae bacterium]
MVTKKIKKNVKKESSEKDCLKKKTASKSAKSKPTTVKKVSAKKVVMVTNVAEKEVLNNNSNAYVIIDHPFENEIISCNTYVIRIGASFDGYVEISFNDGEWQPCRFASGYWWFDWMYFKAGNCKISARLVANDGTIIKLSDIRKCKVS